jgi:sugar phosphate isomerase/epimerase
MRYGCVIAPDQIGAAVAAGFDYIELPARTLEPEGKHELVLRTISRALAKSRRPIKVEVFSSLLPANLAVVGPNVDQERVRRYIHRIFTGMWALGGMLVVLGLGSSRRVPPGFPPEQAAAQFAKTLALIEAQGDRNGLDLVLNPLNRAETNLLTTLDECCQFLSDYDVAGVRLLADSYHLLAEDEPVEVVATCGAQIGHVHLADSDHLPPGQGDFDFMPFFATLREINYDARISLNCSWHDFEQEAPTTLAYVKQQWESSLKDEGQTTADS